MTELNAPPAPPKPSGPPSFGTSIVGAEFNWASVDENGEPVQVTARAISALSFEHTLRYTTARHAQLVHTARSAKSMRDRLGEMDPLSDAYQAEFDQLVQQRLDEEAASWATAIDTLLMLVHEPHRERLRPHLLSGDPRQVQALREWLEETVLGAAKAEAAVTTNVDPTSGPSPENSSSNPDSGDDSGSEGTTSTD